MNVRLVSLAVIRAALSALEAERGVINDLNVYPVPDGDTGTNLALTMRAVLEELEAGDAEGIPAVAAAVTHGSLMGARGNSGVILSQIVRGVCEVWGASEELSTPRFKEALAEGSACAYRAVREPVEGTMLTVVREMATAAGSLPDSLSLANLLVAVAEAGRLAVENTTWQLPVLERAGVVDAGGYGLLVLFRGLEQGIGELLHHGIPAPAEVVLRPGEAGTRPRPAAHGSELSVYKYCTSFVVQGEGIDRDALERFLLPIGDSVLVVGDADAVKVHVHTDDPGVALSEALKHGSLGGVEISDMHEQTRDRDERLRAAAGTAVVAVVAGEGNKGLFRDLGCTAIVDGGQSMNPSAKQVLEAAESLGAGEVIVLPNNGNVILTAEQAAGMSERRIEVVPSSSIAAGLAAMVAFDPESNAAANAERMREAIAGVRSAEVTRAVRDSEVDGIAVRAGQAMGIVDGRLVAVADDVPAAFAGVLEEFARGEAEFVTVLTALNGSGATREELEELAARVAPDTEVSFHEGGQPLYPVLASAE